MTEETVKLELEVPLNVYRSYEYVSSLEPRQDIRKVMSDALITDAPMLPETEWTAHSEFIKDRLEAILRGEEP